ncbi:hypothetical protein ONE63_002690 [Megalurothrips usitatus]|uniref:H/ACA ribonucleoprotein complex non-core subunit NAF1 n=1 Tax=Megalurothrips usitatus TaxID=439358 RepID=A0AAV7XD13_9NEOP|nr:hypothetical protein ONE63_002690 [Megalurothrips usitatus]
MSNEEYSMDPEGMNTESLNGFLNSKVSSSEMEPMQKQALASLNDDTKTGSSQPIHTDLGMSENPDASSGSLKETCLGSVAEAGRIVEVPGQGDCSKPGLVSEDLGSLNAPSAEQTSATKETEDNVMDVCDSDQNVEIVNLKPEIQSPDSAQLEEIENALIDSSTVEESAMKFEICDSPSKTSTLGSPKASTPKSEVLSSNSPVRSICSDNDSEEGISIIKVKAARNDVQFSSLHRGTCAPDSDDTDSSSSSSSEDSSDESSDTDDDSGHLPHDNNAKKTDVSAKGTKVPGELSIDDLPPIEDLHISVPNDQASEIGKVLHAVDTLVVVESYKDQPPLDIDSVLFLDGGARPLGRIFDVMGPVTEPLYCVRFNSKEHIEKYDIEPGMLVYCAPQTEHSNFVFLKHLMMMKGSDASWKKDKEVPLAFLDFSDDEEESNMIKEENRKATVKSQNSDEPRSKAARTERANNLQHQGYSRNSSWEGARQGGHHPRNPWSWSGSRHNFARNHPPSNQNQYSNSGPVRPSTFSVNDSSHQSSDRCQTRNSNYNTESGQQLYSSGNTDVSQQSVPQYSSVPQFGQLPHNVQHYSSAWPTWGQPPPSHTEGYPGNFSPLIPPATQDLRYQAFRSQIDRLVDAYNRGVDTPMVKATSSARYKV